MRSASELEPPRFHCLFLCLKVQGLKRLCTTNGLGAGAGAGRAAFTLWSTLCCWGAAVDMTLQRSCCRWFHSSLPFSTLSHAALSITCSSRWCVTFDAARRRKHLPLLQRS